MGEIWAEVWERLALSWYSAACCRPLKLFSQWVEHLKYRVVPSVVYSSAQRST